MTFMLRLKGRFPLPPCIRHAVRWPLRFSLAGAVISFCFIGESPQAHAMQIGASGSGLSAVSEVRVHISAPSKFVHGSLARTYWAGVTFPNNIFFQAGIADSSTNWGSDSCTTGFSTFVTGINVSTGKNVFSDLYHLQHCNLTGGHWFKLAISVHAEDHVAWHWCMDGAPIGPALQLLPSQDHVIRNAAGAVSEVVYAGSLGSTALPTVSYSPGIQFEPTDGASWVDVTKGLFVASRDRTCQYGLRVFSPNDFETGLARTINPAKCHSSGDVLWDG